MAMLISRASGNFTSSSTWGVADSATGSQLTNPSASTNTTTSYVYSSTFTGTNTRVADGIALFLKRLNTTGTVTVALSDDNGVTATRSVTVNASDLPADESWVFFKFGTTLTLDGGTDYRVGVVASDAANAAVYRDSTAGNWARMVSTTLTAAPAATDTMLIVGEWTGAGASSSYTVTMDNTTTTDFGTNTATAQPFQNSPNTFNGMQIGQNGTLTWGTSAATNYYLRVSGHVVVWSGGTYNMGTSGTPCPRDSTMTLQMDSTGISASNTFTFCAFNGASLSIYGQSRTSGKNIVQCKLSADAAANATSLTVDVDTGWLDNDEITIASTSRTASESEIGTLNGNAGASTLTVDGFAGTAGGLAFAHSGTSPTQAEIIHLTRNVIIRNSTTNPDSNLFGFRIAETASCNIYWCRFLNYSSAAANYSSSILTTNSTINVFYCAFSFGKTSSAFRGRCNLSGNNLNFSDCVFSIGSSDSSTVAISNPPVTAQNVTVISDGTGAGFTLGIILTEKTYSNFSIAGTSYGALITTPSATSLTLNDFIIHSCSGSGVAGQTGGTIVPTTTLTINNFKIWRCTSSGFATNFTGRTTVNNTVIFGCATSSVSSGSSGNQLVTFNDSLFAGEASFSSGIGLNLSATGNINGQYTFNNCQFSPTSGMYVPHTTADISLAGSSTRPMITLNNTLLGASTEVASQQNLGFTGFIKSSKHDQTEGAFKSWFQSGVIERDTTIFNTAAPSERLTPTSATIKLASGPRLVAVDDGGTITINAYVRKSATGDGAAYNGNQPRLMVRVNLACGITTDTVLDTMTVGTGTWEQLTGTTAAVDADGALEFYVDCDGTTGWINVDDWSVT